MSVDQFPTRRFVSRQARLIAVVLWVLLGFAWWGVATSTASDILGQVLITAALILASWLVLWRPHITVTSHHVVVGNPCRRHIIPWAAISLVDTTWQVMLTTKTTRIGVWSAVAGGRHKSFWASRDQGEHLPLSTYRGGVVKPGDLLGTESGEIAAVIRHYWERLRHTPPHTPPHTLPDTAPDAASNTPSQTTDWLCVVGGGVAVALGIAGLVVMSG